MLKHLAMGIGVLLWFAGAVLFERYSLETGGLGVYGFITVGAVLLAVRFSDR